MSYLDAVKGGMECVPRRVMIYGEHGVGKTTWAASWPEPLLLPIEEGYHHLDVDHGPRLTTSEGINRAIRDVADSDYRTIIVDSVDWVEKILQQELDASNFDQSYGKGTIEIGHRMSRVLEGLGLLRECGKHVVLVGHHSIKTVERPDGAHYQKHSAKLGKYSCPLVLEWCDEVLFCQRDYLVKTIKGSFGREQGVGVDKETRSLYTVGTPAYDAKNRGPDDLPEKFDLRDITTYLSYFGEKNGS